MWLQGTSHTFYTFFQCHPRYKSSDLIISFTKGKTDWMVGSFVFSNILDVIKIDENLAIISSSNSQGGQVNTCIAIVAIPVVFLLKFLLILLSCLCLEVDLYTFL